MEGLAGIPTMGGRVAQSANHMAKLKHGSWPAMGHKQRHGIGFRRTHMQEVNSQSLDLCSVLPKAVEQRLTAPPIITIAPIVAECLDFCEWRPLSRVVHRFSIRPSCALQTLV